VCGIFFQAVGPKSFQNPEVNGASVAVASRVVVSAILFILIVVD